MGLVPRILELFGYGVQFLLNVFKYVIRFDTDGTVFSVNHFAIFGSFDFQDTCNDFFNCLNFSPLVCVCAWFKIDCLHFKMFRIQIYEMILKCPNLF